MYEAIRVLTNDFAKTYKEIERSEDLGKDPLDKVERKEIINIIRIGRQKLSRE